jgi:peptide/nickel transport system ATP-binding protein
VSVGLSRAYVRGKYARQFSGGELQRISIARALIARPKVIVADEPVSMVDASQKMNIVNLFQQLKEERGVSFVYITHDLSTAYYLSDDVVIMHKGSIVERGSPDVLFERPTHEYTRLLLDSIAGVDEKWDLDNVAAGA